MIKLLICLVTAAGTSLFLLHLRHQQLELRHQNNELHDKIAAQQSRLWNQQLQIATFTAPNAIAETVKGQDIEMIPRFSLPASFVTTDSDKSGTYQSTPSKKSKIGGDR